MLVPILALVIIVLLVLVYFFYSKNRGLTQVIAEASFNKASQSVKYGQLTEQWLPFAEKFPHNSQAFRFIGSPIDGIAFEDDQIVFCEFKANQSQLSEKQKRIKKLVQEKKVDWLEFRIK